VHCRPLSRAGRLRRLLSERDDSLKKKDQEISELRSRLDRLTAELGNSHNKVRLAACSQGLFPNGRCAGAGVCPRTGRSMLLGCRLLHSLLAADAKGPRRCAGLAPLGPCAVG
jgi:hypothetical protein